jgi:quinol monooxygenase YgiN
MMAKKLKRVPVLPLVRRSPMTSAGVGGPNVGGVVQTKERPMVIVAGYLIVEPLQRDSYLVGCKTVVERARSTPGCLDFAISADLLDPSRIDIFERWESQAAVDAFRGSGPSDEQQGSIMSASVSEYDVEGKRRLT